MVTAAAMVVLAVALFLVFFYPVWALEFFYRDTTVVDFNAGILDHTALSWRDDGEVQLLPIGLGQPWAPGNNTGLPPRSGHASVYYGGHIYVLGGEYQAGFAEGDVYYTTVYTSVYTITGRLADWTATTPLPDALYVDGVVFHDAVALNGYLYVFGGKEDDGAVSTYYDNVVFAPIQPDGTLGSWQETASLPIQMFAMEVQVLHSYIYLLGGIDAQTGSSVNTAYYAQPDPVSGQISGWTPTSDLPSLPPGAGGYFGAAAAVEHERIYVYGGASGVVAPSVSPFVFFSEPNSVTGSIANWENNIETMGLNLFASEGAAYEAGLLLAVAGANNNIYNPTGDVLATLVEHDTGETGVWASTIGLEPGRFWHTVVQDEDGWLYCVGGSTGYGNVSLNDVEIAAPYSGGGAGLRELYRAEATTPTVYAPDGVFVSRQRELLIADAPVKLTSLAWNTTITNPVVMELTLEYRYHEPNGDWTAWFGPFASSPGYAVTTSMAITGTCDFFQYRASFTTTVYTQTPRLNQVRIGVLAPPDLVAEDLTVTGCDTCPEIIPPDQPVQIEFTIRNQSTSLREDNNFFAMLFITTTSEYRPEPPACPPGCDCSDIASCPLAWSLQGYQLYEGAALVLTTTYTFEESGVYYLVAYVDYNDTPSKPAPIYEVSEFNESNNAFELSVDVGYKNIYLPLVFKSWP